MLKIIYHS